MPQSPFKFLDSYTREDRDIYFGRSRETEALYTAVFKSKMVLLYGVSGTGKSSLIQCGLANKFQESDWLPVFVRRGRDMLDSLFQSLIQTHIEAPRLPKKRTAKGFLKLLQSLYLDHFKPVYLIFDQFEELFIFGNKEERDEFVQLMEALQESDVQVKVIFSIREEYLAMLTEFEDRLPELFLNRIRVERMHFPQAKEVIQGACQYANIEIEEGFEEQLLEKLTGGKKELELTYLQVLLDRLWKKSGEGKNGFTLTLLESMGHISDLLGQFLEEQINELEKPEQGLTVLKTFVSVQGTKKQLTFEEINQGCLSLGQELDEKAVQDLLHRFTDLRILRDKDESGRYELRHDSLAAKIYEKITLAEKELMEVRQFVEQAYQLYEKKGIILSADSLSFVAPYRQRLFLKPKIRAFIDASRHYYERKAKRRRRILTWSISAALVIAIVSGIFIWRDLQATREAARIATAHNLANQSLDLLQDDPKQAFKIAVDAYNLEPDYLSKKAVMNAFYQGPFERYELNTAGKSISFTNDGRYIVMTSKYGINNDIDVYDFQSGDTAYFCQLHKSQLLTPVFSSFLLNSTFIYNANNEVFITASKDGLVAFWSPRGFVYKEVLMPSEITGYWENGNSVYIAMDSCIRKYNIYGDLISEIQIDCKIKYFLPIDSSSLIGYFIRGENSGFLLVDVGMKNDFREFIIPDSLDSLEFENIIMHPLLMKDVGNDNSIIVFAYRNAYGEKFVLLDSISNKFNIVDDYSGFWVLSYHLHGERILSIQFCHGTCDFKFFEICDLKMRELHEVSDYKFTQVRRISDTLIAGISQSDVILIDTKSKKLAKHFEQVFLKEVTYNKSDYFLWFKDSKNNSMMVLNKDYDTLLEVSSYFLGNSWSISRITDENLVLHNYETQDDYLISGADLTLRHWRKAAEKHFKASTLPYSISDQCFVQVCQNEKLSIKTYALSDFNSWDYNVDFTIDTLYSEDYFGNSILHDDHYFVHFDHYHRIILVYDYMNSCEVAKIKPKQSITKLFDFQLFDSVLVTISDKGLSADNIYTNENYISDTGISRYSKILHSQLENCLFFLLNYREPCIYFYNQNYSFFGECCVPDSLWRKSWNYNVNPTNDSNYIVLHVPEDQSVYFLNEMDMKFEYAFDYDIYRGYVRDIDYMQPKISLSDNQLLAVYMLDSVKLYNLSGEEQYGCISGFENISDCEIIKSADNQLGLFLKTEEIITEEIYGRKGIRGKNVTDSEIIYPYSDYRKSAYISNPESIEYKFGLLEAYQNIYFNDHLRKLLELKKYLNFQVINLSIDSLGNTNKLVLNDLQKFDKDFGIDNLWVSKPYLLKLPVTVPRMFEVLQESGLDTTYGFDNIPKNF